MPNDLNGNITNKLNQNGDNDGLVKSEEVSKEAKETVNKVKLIYTKGKYNEDVKNLKKGALKRLYGIIFKKMSAEERTNHLNNLRREYNERSDDLYDRYKNSNNVSYAAADDYYEENQKAA